MPEITRLRELSANEVLVELDGAPWRKIPLNAASRAGLSVGKRLEREDLRLLRHELRRAEALTKATRMLARRPLPRTLLEERLERKGVAPAALEEAVDVLEQAHYLNDHAYRSAEPRDWRNEATGTRPSATSSSRRSVASELIEEALDSLEPELERARAITRSIPDRKKLLGRLARRGFDPEIVERIAAPSDSLRSED